MFHKKNTLMLLLSCSGSLLASESLVVFDHSENTFLAKEVSANPGDLITVRIENTCLKEFDYELGGIAQNPPSSGTSIGQEILDQACEAGSHFLTEIHNDRFGGYYLKIKKKNNNGVSVKAKVKDKEVMLEDSLYLVSVKSSQWDIAFAGGFTVSDLVDPIYSSKKNDADQNIIVRARSAEDDVSLGLSAMVHVFHQKRPRWAATFGVATGNSGETSYMAGPSLRFGDQAAFTLGYMWSRVKRLPSGLSVGDLVEDPNTLVDLSSKTKGGMFLSFSYSFLSGSKAALGKPFKVGAVVPQSGGSSSETNTAPTPAAVPSS